MTHRAPTQEAGTIPTWSGAAPLTWHLGLVLGLLAGLVIGAAL